MTPILSTPEALLLRGNCLAEPPPRDELAAWAGPEARVQLLLTDPPYGIGHASADEAEDGDWDTAEHRLDYAAALRRLRPLCASNSTAYVFGPVGTFLDARSALPPSSGWSPLQDLVWLKEGAAPPSGRADPDSLRTYYPDTERILFCEASAPAGASTPERDAERAWRLREQREHDRLMAPLVAYFAAALAASGYTLEQVRSRWRARVPGASGAMLSHYLTPHQWQLPTREAYATLAAILNEPIDRRHSAAEGLRREREGLRREWEDLRRPFFAADGRTPSDLLRYPPVPRETRLHPCQKPVGLLSYLIRTSTRPGDIVLDPFGGSGSTAVAAIAAGRSCLLVERDEPTARLAADRILGELRAPRLLA